MVQIPGENSNLIRSIHLGRVTKIHSPSSALSKDEVLKNIGHSMSIRNLIPGVNSAAVSYLIRYDSLLQNATDIVTKCDSNFITKCDRFITKCGSYYKIRRLLQIATVDAEINKQEQIIF